MDLGWLRQQEKHTFSTNEQPAAVLVGYLGSGKLRVLDLATGKKIAFKRVAASGATIIVQPLNFSNTGRYEIYCDVRHDPDTSCDISVDRAPKTPPPGKTNEVKIDPLWPRRIRLYLDPKKSWKNFDTAFINKVEQKWFDLIDKDTSPIHHGAILLRFKMMADGQISEMTVSKNTAGSEEAIMCRKAILEPAPYGHCPTELLKKFGGDHRDIQFSFYY